MFKGVKIANYWKGIFGALVKHINNEGSKTHANRVCQKVMGVIHFWMYMSNWGEIENDDDDWENCMMWFLSIPFIYFPIIHLKVQLTDMEIVVITWSVLTKCYLGIQIEENEVGGMCHIGEHSSIRVFMGKPASKRRLRRPTH